MKEEAPDSDEQISNKGNQKNGIMALLEATSDASVSEIEEEKVCRRIDSLRQVDCRIIVLCGISLCCGDIGYIQRQTSSHQLMVDVMGAQ